MSWEKRSGRRDVVLDGGDYTYTADNPVISSDPTGLMACNADSDCSPTRNPGGDMPYGNPVSNSSLTSSEGSGGGGGSCPDWDLGCPGFTGGGTGPGGEPGYDQLMIRPVYPTQQKVAAASFQDSHSKASAPTCIMGAASRFDQIPGCRAGRFADDIL